jgi:hypothetical protein
MNADDNFYVAIHLEKHIPSYLCEVTVGKRKIHEDPESV